MDGWRGLLRPSVFFALMEMTDSFTRWMALLAEVGTEGRREGA